MIRFRIWALNILFSPAILLILIIALADLAIRKMWARWRNKP